MNEKNHGITRRAFLKVAAAGAAIALSMRHNPVLAKNALEYNISRPKTKKLNYTEKITDDIYLFRMNDTSVKYFEALWRIPEGITYNAYLLKTSNGTVLFDGWKKEYEKEFIQALSRVVDPEEIDYIVIQHTEPDHSGTLPKILELNNYRAQVLGHPAVGALINSFYGLKDKAKFRAVNDGEVLKIGNKRLRFIHAPFLHWPDTIFSYLVDDGVLFTCDAFGGYSIPKTTFDDSERIVSDYLPPVKRYVVNVVGHYKEYIIENIQKVVNLGIIIKMILPSHGLLWKNNPQTIVNYYLDVAKGVPEKGKVLVVYGSMYGFVEKAVNVAIEELKRLNYKPEVIKFTDKFHGSTSYMLGEVADSEAIILGAATYEAGIFPFMKDVIDLFSKKADYEKPVLVLSSYGWHGVAGENMASLLSETKFKVIDTIEFNGSLQKEDEDRIKKSIKKLLSTHLSREDEREVDKMAGTDMKNELKEYRCTVCGYIYNPEKGDPDAGIEPGTPFEELPDDWVCPVCGVGKEDFERI